VRRTRKAEVTTDVEVRDDSGASVCRGSFVWQIRRSLAESRALHPIRGPGRPGRPPASIERRPARAPGEAARCQSGLSLSPRLACVGEHA
jgi:hypothetical protein